MAQQPGATKRWTWLALGAIAAALVGGYTLGKVSGPPAVELPAPGLAVPATPGAKPTVWTCSMHPQVRLDAPGRCPICDMPLIPAETEEGSEAAPALTLSEYARTMASVETVAVEPRHLARDIRATGKIQYESCQKKTAAMGDH